MLKFINPFAQPTLVVAGVSASGCSWRCRDSNGCSDGLGFRGAPRPLRPVRLLSQLPAVSAGWGR